MADWKDNLVPASFRGKPFHYLDNELVGGRRLAEHEFPLRDTPYVEDMGRKRRQYRVQAYVIGDDYFAQRDALKDALEQAGSGTFVHPYQGQIDVFVAGFRLNESVVKGRMASFDIEFVESGTKPSPTSATDTSTAASGAAAAAGGVAGSSFLSAYGVTGFLASVTTAAQGVLSAIDDAIAPVLAVANEIQSAAAELVDSLVSLAEEPAEIETALIGFFQGFAGDVAALASVFDDNTSSRGPQPPADPSYGLAPMTHWGDDLPAVDETTPAREQEALNQLALVTLVQSAATVGLAILYANTDFVSEGDAEAARDQVTDAIDALAIKAADAGDDNAYAAWLTLYTAVTADLTERGKQLPNVVRFDMARTLPALTLAERFYADAARAGELIARNRAPHPLFMPLQVEALSF